jgi:SAM-dependent methyltransferase
MSMARGRAGGDAPKKIRAGAMTRGVLMRVAHPRHLWTAIKLHRGRKADRVAGKKARGDAQLQFIAQILPDGFLHYGYFDDPDRQPEDITLNDVRRAQLRYAEVLAEQVTDRSAPALDVGCGMGGLVRLLRERGFTPVALTPDAAQITHVREQFPQVESIHAKFEELPAAAHEGRYGTVVTSESLQYLKLDQALPLLERVLKPGGRWVACDYFRTTEAPAPDLATGPRGKGGGGARERSGHYWDAFARRVRDAGWEVALERDITPNVLPTLRYVHMWGERFGMPLLGYVVGRLRRKQPGLHYVLENVLNEVESVLADNLQIVDPAIFAARKRYMLLVMTRR